MDGPFRGPSKPGEGHAVESASRAEVHVYPLLALAAGDPRAVEVALGSRSDPRALLEELRLPVLFDEIQNVPELFGNIRTRTDRNPREIGRWLFTGSQEAPWMQRVSESMAGPLGALRRSMGDRTPVRQTVVHRASTTAPPTRALAPWVDALDVQSFAAVLAGEPKRTAKAKARLAARLLAEGR